MSDRHAYLPSPEQLAGQKAEAFFQFLIDHTEADELEVTMTFRGAVTETATKGYRRGRPSVGVDRRTHVG